MNERRRWFQVSLKSLLLLMLVLAAYFAGMATMMRRADEAILAEQEARKRAVAAENLAKSNAAEAMRQRTIAEQNVKRAMSTERLARLNEQMAQKAWKKALTDMRRLEAELEGLRGTKSPAPTSGSHAANR